VSTCVGREMRIVVESWSIGQYCLVVLASRCVQEISVNR
jgi:hypothetical protein